MNHLLNNLLIQPDVLSREGIDFLINHAKTSHSEHIGTFDMEAANKNRKIDASGENAKIDLSVRNVKYSSISSILGELKDLYQDIVDNVINPFYGHKINDSELPQLLTYGPGGHYEAHHDAVSLWKNPDDTIIWKKTIDRDLSTVIFLNDDFEGGEFVFPELRVRIRPEPGLMIAFPSSQFYLHKVEPVISGTRYAMVNWFTFHGFPTKEEMDREIEEKYGIKAY